MLAAMAEAAVCRGAEKPFNTPTRALFNPAESGVRPSNFVYKLLVQVNALLPFVWKYSADPMTAARNCSSGLGLPAPVEGCASTGSQTCKSPAPAERNR